MTVKIDLRTIANNINNEARESLKQSITSAILSKDFDYAEELILLSFDIKKIHGFKDQILSTVEIRDFHQAIIEGRAARGFDLIHTSKKK